MLPRVQKVNVVLKVKMASQDLQVYLVNKEILEFPE